MVEKTLDIRVRALMGDEMGKLQRHLESIGMMNMRAGKTGKEAMYDMAEGFKGADREARKLNGTIENSAKYLQLIKGVVSAFLLYRGFSFLTSQTSEFFKELVGVQHQVALIQTQLNDTGKDFRPMLTQNILRIAGETGVAMETLAKAEYQVTSANIKVADSFEILELSAKAAVAGGLKDVDLAFNSALSQANVFGESFAEIYDKQFQVLKRGIFNYEQFATVVGTLSEAFASMGQDVETANASLAAISQVFTGAQLERGATGLRNAILRISEAPEDFEALGVSVTDAAGNFRNFLAIAKDLKVALDGMGQRQRMTVLKNLFPDERERRGIGAFLGQLDKAEQFLVEQHFAADGLNEAYETVNDSLQTQANMFRNDLVPAMQPFVDMAGVLLGVFNGMDAVLPGLNKNLLTTATVAAVIGGTMLMSGGKLSMSRGSNSIGAIDMIGGGKVPGTGIKVPTKFGMGVGGLMAATSFAAGMQPGAAQGGDYLGAGIAGAVTGNMMGGPVGAAVGAAVSMAVLALGDAMGDKSGPVANNFAEAFSVELEKRAGGIADAFRDALNAEIKGVIPAGGGDSDFGLSSRGRPWGMKAFGTDEQRQQLEQILKMGGRVGIYQSQSTPFGSSQNRKWFEGAEDVDAMMKELKTEYAGFANVKKRAEVQVTETNRRSMIREVLGGEAGFTQFLQDVRSRAPVESKYYGVSQEEFVKTSVDQGTRDIPSDLSTLGRETAVAMGVFAQALADGTKKADGTVVSMDDLDTALDILGEGTLEQQKAFLRFIGVMNDASIAIETTFDSLAMKFESLFSGDADMVASVFQHMGTDGENLAAVFRRMATTMRAFELMKTMQDFETVNPKIEEQKAKAQKKLDEYRAVVNEYDTRGDTWTNQDGSQFFVKSWLSPDEVKRRDAYAAAADTQERRIQRLDDAPGTNVLKSLGVDSMLATEMLTDKLVEDLGLVKGNFSTEDFVNALLTEATPEVPKLPDPKILELATNSLADSLFAASDQVRNGILDGMSRTADELEMLGEEFKDLNHLVRQRSILEELKGMADFAGVDSSGIQGAMDILRENMIKSGKALFDILGDPASLAELIANMEFGDVNVDNSTQNTFTLRLSGDSSTDPANLARIADQLVALIDDRTRKRVR